MEPLRLSPSEFVALLNQTLEVAYPSVVIEGELANVRVSKNKWVFFDIKDESASVKCFGTVYALPGPVENGMQVRIVAMPRMHPQWGFSLTVSTMLLVGEGSIKKAYDLLYKKLEAEGLFAEDRKRDIPYPPARIGLVTSGESAAYADFIKILGARFGGIEVLLADVQVQGESASQQVARAIEHFNTLGQPPDVLVITRGGGSSDDLQAFNTEVVARAVAGSRIPTVAAIGHEIDLSLAELAADLRASTPSNAAELLVPEKSVLLSGLTQFRQQATKQLDVRLEIMREELTAAVNDIRAGIEQVLSNAQEDLTQKRTLLSLIDPSHILKRGYAVVRSKDKTLRSVQSVSDGEPISVQLMDGTFNAVVKE